MSCLRCALIAPDSTAGVAPSVLSTLDHMKDLVVERLTDGARDSRCWTAIDGAIVVFDRASLTSELEQISQILSANPCCSVVAVGDAPDEDALLSLLAAGVYDFVASPFAPAELKARVRRALGLAAARPLAAPRAAGDLRLRGLIGTSAAFVRQTVKLPTLARHDVGVLLLGETGTGKEVFAQAIHYLSSRASRPWVAVNCAAIPPELIESELFGHVRGAYTTAHTARKGLVSEADGGTLLLDEIDCLPYNAQAKLLRFLQEKEFRPVGSNGLCHADVRVIATSNSPLADRAAKGTFRADLYFRLNVLSVTLPPLRERLEDIPLLALHFIQHFGREFNRRVTGLSPVALRRLTAHGWPGNIRELKHVIERAVLLSNGPLLGAEALDLDDGLNDPLNDASNDAAREPIDDESFRAAKARTVETFERAYIERALQTCGGNVTNAARLAKKNRRAFWELLRKHRIDPQPFR